MDLLFGYFGDGFNCLAGVNDTSVKSGVFITEDISLS
jgi:hypothetical protein